MKKIKKLVQVSVDLEALTAKQLVPISGAKATISTAAEIRG